MKNYPKIPVKKYLSFGFAWLLDCSAPGVSRIILSTNFRRKFFWLVSVLICGLLLCGQVWVFLDEVRGHPITVNFQIEQQDHLPFPSVTVCNSNKFKQSEVENLNNKLDLYKTVLYTKLEAITLRENYNLILSRSQRRKSRTSVETNLTNDTFLPFQQNGRGCVKNRSYLGEKQLLDQHSAGPHFSIIDTHGFARSNIAYDYSDQISPNNQFQCNDGHCISQVWILKKK